MAQAQAGAGRAQPRHGQRGRGDDTAGRGPTSPTPTKALLVYPGFHQVNQFLLGVHI